MNEFKEGDRVYWAGESDNAFGYVAYVIDGWVGVVWGDTNELEDYEIEHTPEIWSSE